MTMWIVGAMLLVTATGCIHRPLAGPRTPVRPLIEAAPFSRVLVAGFVSIPSDGVDANEETSRVLRHELRSQLSLDVVNMDPLPLRAPMLDDVPFWRRLGEEYRGPLIVTGNVDFKSAGSYYEERQAGRRTLRIWLPRYSLIVHLLLVDGKTGRRIAAAVCGPTVLHADTGRERALNLYYRLVDRTMPSILAVFGRRSAFRSGSTPICRPE